jgi:hypothetical protein
MQNKVLELLREACVPYTEDRAVPWNTISAALREMYERGETLNDTELQTIGATVGKRVRLIPKKG